MTRYTLLVLLLLSYGACRAPGGAPRDPGSPTPVPDPRSAPGTVIGAGDAGIGAGTGGGREVPVRPDEAPLVPVREALNNDTLLGRRVRISGRCSARGEGRRAGSWTLDQAGAAIEVRGLVPSSCAPEGGEELTIFAQIEPRAPGSTERILLRLPD